VTEELMAAGVAEPMLPGPLHRLFRHETLRVQREAEAAARERLADVLTGRPSTPAAIALASAQHRCETLDEVAGVRLGRRRLRAMTDASRSLGPGVQVVLATLEERRRAARIAA
jgi:hypothetical protein